MKPLWAIQKFISESDDSKGMIENIHSLGLEHHILNIDPFDYDSIDPVKHDGPVIPYGGTKLIDAIKDDDNWFCAFNDDFSYSVAIENYGKRMFNGDGHCMKMKDFSPSMFKEEGVFFIRPDKDIKEFAGHVIEVEEFLKWYNLIKGQGWQVNEDTLIIVAPASRIDFEWRMFIVDNEVVSGSQYRKNQKLRISSEVPDIVYEYVKEAIAIWQPAPFFVMDICMVGTELSIVEVGDFHSAGWYASDKRSIIEAISNYSIKELSNA